MQGGNLPRASMRFGVQLYRYVCKCCFDSCFSSLLDRTRLVSGCTANGLSCLAAVSICHDGGLPRHDIISVLPRHHDACVLPRHASICVLPRDRKWQLGMTCH